jgi:hypothetical protein
VNADFLVRYARADGLLTLLTAPYTRRAERPDGGL